MCINFETSITAYIIGTISSALLVLRGSNERKIMGFTIMFFSIVQLCEALIYKGYDINGIVSKILLINLGLQGFVYFIMTYYYSKKINKSLYVFLIVSSIIALTIIYNALHFNFSKAELNKCLTWNFINNTIMYLLQFMYLSMFIHFFFFQSNLFIIQSGFILLMTCIISVLLHLQNNYNTPSIWCLTSTLAGPLFLLL